MEVEGHDRKAELASMLDYVRYYHMINMADIELVQDGQLVRSARLSKKWPNCGILILMLSMYS